VYCLLPPLRLVQLPPRLYRQCSLVILREIRLASDHFSHEYWQYRLPVSKVKMVFSKEAIPRHDVRVSMASPCQKVIMPMLDIKAWVAGSWHEAVPMRNAKAWVASSWQ
jgi:hypothetical protein